MDGAKGGVHGLRRFFGGGEGETSVKAEVMVDAVVVEKVGGVDGGMVEEQSERLGDGERVVGGACGIDGNRETTFRELFRHVVGKTRAKKEQSIGKRNRERRLRNFKDCTEQVLGHWLAVAAHGYLIYPSKRKCWWAKSSS